jgi:hypothetical protein
LGLRGKVLSRARDVGTWNCGAIIEGFIDFSMMVFFMMESTLCKWFEENNGCLRTFRRSYQRGVDRLNCEQ